MALRGLQLAASGGAGRHGPDAVSDLSRNERGAPIRRLLYVLELRRGFARCVHRRAQTSRQVSGLVERQGRAVALMSHSDRAISVGMAPALRSSEPARDRIRRQ